MWDFVKRWFALHHLSTYMIFLALVMAALTAHPTTIAYVMIVGVLGPWLFILREVARIEGLAPGFQLASFWTLGFAGSILLIAFLVILKIQWVAI